MDKLGEGKGAKLGEGEGDKLGKGENIGNLSWLNLTFGQGSPSLAPSPSPS